MPDFLSPEQLQALILALAAWAWLFVLAPARAFKTGISLDDPPISLKMQSFKVLQGVALIVMLTGAYFSPPTLLFNNISKLSHDFENGLHLGGIVAAVIVAMILIVWPHLTSAKRLKNSMDPGEWRTVTLSFYRWFMLGLIVFGTLAFASDFNLIGDPLVGAGLGAGVCLFYLIWWSLPSAQVSRHVDDGSPYAQSRLGDVRKFGLFAWIGYMLERRRIKEGDDDDEEHKFCPSCMRTVDDVTRYRTLEFDKCPFCHEMIPPVFKVDDYIRDRAQRLIELSELRREGGAKKKQLRLAEEESKDLMGTILHAIITMAIRERGTDLHMGRDNNRFVVRCRTDGMLFTMLSLPEELMRTMVSAVKVQCNLDITEREKPQDGSFSQKIDGKTIDARVNTSPSRTGETITMRLLNQNMVFGSLDDLGFTKRNLEMFKAKIANPHGMILVTGPTGSGKTTTLYNALSTLADGKRNIITLEDPIEFEIEGLNQMQINTRKEFTFASGLRTILRQDPDVIMVGEIRDAETAKMATDAAMTGHLVFSTLHTIDTATTLGRLSDLEVDPQRHSEALLMIIAQRLIRLNCSECLESIQIRAEKFELFGLKGAPECSTLKRGRGCEHCHETGFYGREGIYEIMSATSKLKSVISSGAPPQVVRDQARRDGMRTLMEDGLTRVLLGKSTLDELKRVTS